MHTLASTLAAMEAPRKKAARSRVSNLPNHLLMEILCRLPIQSLIFCKSVCKSWFNLISTDSDFAKLHLQRSPSELLFYSSCIYGPSSRFYLGTIQFHNNSAPNLKLTLLFDLPKFGVSFGNSIDYRITDRKELHFFNSCNGLVCFFNYYPNDFYAMICNPITGEFMTFPAPKRGKNRPHFVACGLGFSGKANRYKLLRLMEHKDVDFKRRSSKVFVEICTFEKRSRSSWRNIGDSPYTAGDVESWSNAVFLEGKLHMNRLACSRPYTVISCFDFDDELFKEVPLPPGHIDNSGMMIGILGGCLSLSHFRLGSNSCVDIWVMKEYGVRDSWTKTFSIAKCNPSESLSERDHIPIEHLDIGEILMLHQNKDLILHSPIVNSIRSIGRLDNMKVNAFRPSLLLLKDALMGYDATVHNVNSRHADLERQKLAAIRWWESAEKNYVQRSPQEQGSEAPLTNDVAVAGEERNGDASPTSEFSVSESSNALLVHEQGTDDLTSDGIHVPAVGEERHGPVSGTGLSQTPASSSATHVTTESPWEEIKTMMEELGELLRKERQQRQELEQRLQNEEAKVEQLKEQIQRSEQLKQENQQKALKLVDEMRAHIADSH